MAGGLAPRGPMMTEPLRGVGGLLAEGWAPGLVEPGGDVAISWRYREEGAHVMRAVNGIWGSEPPQVGGLYRGTQVSRSPPALWQFLGSNEKRALA